jgi:phosphatidylglycerophosphate synthase
MVARLVGTAVTPNHLTTARLITGIAACGAFAAGTVLWNLWGGLIWIVSCLLDRADGELARLSGRTSPGGHKYDYASDVAVNALVFFAIGIGLRESGLGHWAIALGAVAGISVAAASILSEKLESTDKAGEKAYSGVAGFDFDDLLYLFAPAAWLGWFIYMLVGAAAVAPILALLTAWRLRAQANRSG